MQSALKLSVMMLCLSLVSGQQAPSAPAEPTHLVIAGCPASAIVCPDLTKPTTTPKPKPSSSDKKSGHKGGKG